MILCVAILFLFVLRPAPAMASSDCALAGHWTGSWIRNGFALAVDFDFASSDSGWSGTFGSNDFQAAGIPLRAVRCEHGRAHFELAGDQDVTVFDGTVGRRTLAGKFTNGRSVDSLTLTLEATPSGPPYSSEEVRFTSGGANLAGTLLLPSGAGPFPAVVFLQGSGPENRRANFFLADRCSRAGIAALIYDKRGVGASSGDWRTAGFDSLASDALAGVEWLRADRRIRPDAVGIFGHSQGATLSPLVAAKSSHVAFVIASAPSGVSMSDLERFSLLNAVKARQLSGADSARAVGYVDLVVRTEYGGGAWATLDSAATASKGKPWYFPVPGADDPFWAFSRSNATYDPRAFWSRVRVPVLLLFGERDERGPTAESRRNIEAALGRAHNDRFTTIEFRNADHSLRMASTDPGSPWPHAAPGYPEAMIDWIRKQGVQPPASGAVRSR